jgi:hypothetical protein
LETECCPRLPSITTLDDPAPGSVASELTFADLETIFSNRAAALNGNWDAAFALLEHEIDPENKYRLWNRDAPSPDTSVARTEGGLTYTLLYGPIQLQPGGQMPRQPNRWTNVADSVAVVRALLNTIARCNKYGEPARGLRAASVAAARFLTDDLARVPDMPSQQDTKAFRLRVAGMAARTTLAAALSGAPVARPASGMELALESRDLTGAALDVVRTVDDVVRTQLTALAAGPPDDPFACRARARLGTAPACTPLK